LAVGVELGALSFSRITSAKAPFVAGLLFLWRRRLRGRAGSKMLRYFPRSMRHFLEQQTLHLDPLRRMKAPASVLDACHTSRPETRTPFESRLGKPGEDAKLTEVLSRERLFSFDGIDQ
jgi:hypothetical protein